MKSTVLNAAHRRLGARMVPFAGWDMPVQYAGILEEIAAVRQRAGLFDLGHMGRVHVHGKDALALLQHVQCNDAAQIQPGAIRYSMFLREDGGILDDILVYREPVADGFFLVVNASNCDQDLALLRAAAAKFADAKVVDTTDSLGMFAIQGPVAAAVTQALTDADLSTLKYYKWMPAKVAGVDLSLSRTGYTGEDGFEFYPPAGDTETLWNALLEEGRARGVVPCGLGARDTLRLEAGMPLYGHEIDTGTNPLEAGLSFAVKFTHDFVGRQALERYQAAPGPDPRRLVGLTSPSKRVPRQGYPVFHGDAELGPVRSGALSPTLDTNIATAYVPGSLAEPGTELTFGVRDKREPAVVAALPFYKRAR
ncbi:MAG: glycine cleavage system aminomethyltransferase GcvT [Planctomycetota bacterium]